MNVNDLLYGEETPLYREKKELLKLLSSPCVWSIIMVLKSYRHGMINITALVNKLNSNYTSVMKCIEKMKSLGLVEDVKIGRLRLIKLNEKSELLKRMLEILSVTS